MNRLRCRRCHLENYFKFRDFFFVSSHLLVYLTFQSLGTNNYYGAWCCCTHRAKHFLCRKALKTKHMKWEEKKAKQRKRKKEKKRETFKRLNNWTVWLRLSSWKRQVVFVFNEFNYIFFSLIFCCLVSFTHRSLRMCDRID